MANALPANGSSLTSAGVALVTAADGDIDTKEGGGLYHQDLLVVDMMVFTIDGQKPRRLNSSRVGPSAERLTYGHWGANPDPRAVVVRERSVRHGYEETIAVTAFREPVDLTIRIILRPGSTMIYGQEMTTPWWTNHRLMDSLWADGLTITSHDGTVILSHAVHLQPRGTTSLRWGIRLHDDEAGVTTPPTIVMPDDASQQVIDRALWDLQALTISEPLTNRPFTAAGAPHFLAVFGRDALTISLLSMLTGATRAMDTLEVLAAYQGTKEDEHTLEEHGRILHELRIGQMGVFGLPAGTPYYGSVDATPLFVVVLAECMRWGADRARLRSLLPAARAAIDWCRHHTDDFGFVRSVPHPSGIDNQGWKDSGDAIVRPDGTVVHDATSLVEVQGYVHQALNDLAELERFVGRPDAAPALLAEAADLRTRFNTHFEAPAGVGFALALDGSGDPVNVRASNIGHLLATDIIDDRAAATIADRLMSPAEFSGWGIRTLSAAEPAYHPLGYHLGTVWPHDNAIIMRGLGFRRADAQVRRMAGALTQLAVANGFQLPELLGGFDRGEFPNPVPYPASARPQGWAAAVPVQIVTSLLGLRPEMQHNRLTFGSLLEPGQSLAVHGLTLGTRIVDIQANGSEVRIDGDVDGLDLIDRNH